MRYRLLPALLLVTILLAACKREKATGYDPDVTRAYFPLTAGRYVTYEVDSTIWDDFSCDTSWKHLQMRYTLADTFRDNQQRLSYEIEVKTRDTGATDWQWSDVIYVTPTAQAMEWVQNNLRFTKLAFPVKEGSAWKGNSYIATNDAALSYFYDWNYTYHQAGQPYNNGRMTVDNTVIVDQIDERQNDPATLPTAYAYRTYGREVYGLNIGLVYRELVHWVYDYNPTPGIPSCTKGYGVVMRAIDHN